MSDSFSRYCGLLRTAFAALLLTACSEPVLEGPNHAAQDPPWIAPGRQATNIEMEVRQRLILIGDAGLYLESDPTLITLNTWAAQVPASSVLYLGDNIYDDGLIDEAREEAERILSQQLAATDAHKVFIPGNHDWGMNPAQQNLTAILNQQAFIDNWSAGNSDYLPRDGCMGPEKLVLPQPDPTAPAVVLVLMDPTPWLTPRLRALCDTDPGDELHFARLEAMLEQHAEDYVIAASHYPLLTGGPHGGLSYGAVADLLVGFIGWMYGGLGNTYEPLYADWIARASAVLRRYPPLIYAAGHDHNLQVLEGGDVAAALVVSGAGAPERVSTVTHLPQTIFAHAAPGFVVLDFGRQGDSEKVQLQVVENGTSGPVFTMLLEKPAI